ncbi:MAG: 16S rRNA (adenine(1518)-N(6)/adenine(1519)-N(6))-dimethyltransferase RsmA [Oscillospiraceae bacterium]|nr:16S rRNA (adenine(1518)-N(6)/adenine(1519)-N(6))-dimethyltransferase RsmA [Oscillospiraceae bacterium]
MILTSPKIIKELLARHGFTLSKSLGQNFLINPTVCPRMAAGCEGKGVIEIGAGAGVLTRELAKVAAKVVVVEIDRGLKPVLDETLADCPNVEIVWGDILKIDLAALIREKFHISPKHEINVCANLPYYITSPVIMRLLEERLPISAITVMVQKEAATRLCALPGTRDCGAVSVAVRYYSTPERLFEVSRNSFLPAPKVDSAVLRLTVHTETKHENLDEQLFFRIVKAAFSQRRKQLANPVSAALHLEKGAVKAALAACGLSPEARAEEVGLGGFVGVCRELKQLK